MHKYNIFLKFNFFSLITFIGCVFILSLLGGLISLCLFGNIFSDINQIKTITELKELNFNDSLKLKMILSLSIKSIFTFILGPIVFIYIESDKTFDQYFKLKKINNPKLLISLIIIIVLLSGILNINLAKFNKSIYLPDFLKNFQTKAAFFDFKINYIMETLSTSKSVLYFFLIIFSFAIIPAIGEELTFRVILQNDLFVFIKNTHLIIIITSIIFALFHLQIYLLLPRIFLSIIIGYIYHWSQNILLPIFYHFINNSIFFSIVFLKNIGLIKINIFENPYIPLFIIIPAFFLLIIFIILFRKINHQKTNF